jgi:PhoH-like ATPase
MTETDQEFMKGIEKIFVVDTSVLLHDAGALNNLAKDKSNLVVIPLCVLEELNNHKTDNGEKGFNARSIIRTIDNLRTNGTPVLSKGVQLALGKGFILINKNGHSVSATFPGMEENNDNKILLAAHEWREKTPKEKKVVVITKDIHMRITADTIEIPAEDYRQDKVIGDINDLYTGYREIKLAEADMDKMGNLYNKGTYIPAGSLPNSLDVKTLLPNQCLKLYWDDDYRLVIYKRSRGIFEYVFNHFNSTSHKKAGIKPRNDRQALLYHLLNDKSINCITVGGKAGTGKSLITFLAACEQAIRGNDYGALLIYKPIIEVGGRGLGYLPGDMDEKMAPWQDAIFDNLKLLVGGEEKNNGDKDKDFDAAEKKQYSPQRIIEDLIKNKIIEIKPTSYIRGRSLNNSFIIADEAQNLTLQEVKTLITRVGENSKIVLLGDIEQIDNPYLDKISNGLTHAVFYFRNYDIAAHIDLVKGERSALAELAANMP